MTHGHKFNAPWCSAMKQERTWADARLEQGSPGLAMSALDPLCRPWKDCLEKPFWAPVKPPPPNRTVTCVDQGPVSSEYPFIFLLSLKELPGGGNCHLV